MNSSAIRSVLLGTAVAVCLGAASASAQGDAATGLPQSLLPESEVSTPGTAGDVPQDTGPAPQEDRPPEPPRRPFADRAAVAVGDLGTLEGPVVGTLDESSGGLGPTLWEGSERRVIETMLQQTPATSSTTSRLLLRKLALTPAPPPPGDGQGPFNALRLRKLLDFGFVDEAADLGAAVRSRDVETQQAQADALLFAGRDADACGEATETRLQSAEAFWVELRAYCYAAAGDSAALDLTRAVIEQQHLTSGDFLLLLDAMRSGKLADQPQGVQTTSVHLRMLSRLDAPIPAAAVELGLPAALIAAASDKTEKIIRLAAAEQAFRVGALPLIELPAILDLFVFRPPDLVGAAALARGEPILPALARLRAGLRAERLMERRAELITTAFRKAEEEGVLPAVAALFADEGASLVPERAWDNWSSIMTRALLLAGRTDAAQRWLDILDEAAPVEASELHYLQLVFAIAAPANAVRLEETLNGLALDAGAVDAQPPARARAALALGLYEATGRDMPDAAREQLAALLTPDHAGLRPAPALMERIEEAALAGHVGETGAAVLNLLGDGGARTLAPDVVVHVVRALRSAGINDAARSLTLEALLTRPTAL